MNYIHKSTDVTKQFTVAFKKKGLQKKDVSVQEVVILEAKELSTGKAVDLSQLQLVKVDIGETSFLTTDSNMTSLSKSFTNYVNKLK